MTKVIASVQFAIDWFFAFEEEWKWDERVPSAPKTNV